MVKYLIYRSGEVILGYSMEGYRRSHNGADLKNSTLSDRQEGKSLDLSKVSGYTEIRIFARVALKGGPISGV